MSTQANKDLWRRFVETFNQGNLAAFDDLFTPEFRPRDTVMPIPPGPVGMQQLAGVVRSAFSDAHETIGDLIAEGDKVMMYATLRGTHNGRVPWYCPDGQGRGVEGRGDRSCGEREVRGDLAGA